MASFSLLLALSGFRYSAVERMLAFEPRVHAEDFRCFFAAGSAWGLYRQSLKTGVLAAKLECRYGNLTLRRLVLGEGAIAARFAKARLNGPDGAPVACLLKSRGGVHELELPNQLTLRESESATLTLTS